MLPILLGLVAVGMMTVGAWMVWRLNPSVRGQGGGDVFVGIGVLVALACIAGTCISLKMRLKK